MEKRQAVVLDNECWSNSYDCGLLLEASRQFPLCDRVTAKLCHFIVSTRSVSDVNPRTANSVSAVRFSKSDRRFGDGFLRCFIHNSSCSMIGSTVNIFRHIFMPYLCTSSSESLRLTISWTNSAWKYVISSVMHIKQHTVQKNRTKNRNRGLFSKTKTEAKTAVFSKPNRSHFFANRTPL